MFDELNKYKNSGHFFFQKGDTMSEQRKNVPNLPGVFYILRLARGKVDLVYIGKSGTVLKNGRFKNPTLMGNFMSDRTGIEEQLNLQQIMEQEDIDALDIYWFVTFDKQHQDLPAFVEGLIMQRYFEVYGCLPPWNQEF